MLEDIFFPGVGRLDVVPVLYGCCSQQQSKSATMLVHRTDRCGPSGCSHVRVSSYGKALFPLHLLHFRIPKQFAQRVLAYRQVHPGTVGLNPEALAPLGVQSHSSCS